MKIVDFDETKLQNPNHPKIKDLLDNEETYIAELKAMSDKTLSQKLDTVRIQKQWAYEQKKWLEFEVLRLFEDMIIAARVLRSEENPDSKEYDEPVAKPKKKKEITDKVEAESEEQIIEEVLNEAESSDKIENNNSEQLTLFDLNSDD